MRGECNARPTVTFPAYMVLTAPTQRGMARLSWPAWIRQEIRLTVVVEQDSIVGLDRLERRRVRLTVAPVDAAGRVAVRRLTSQSLRMTDDGPVNLRVVHSSERMYLYSVQTLSSSINLICRPCTGTIKTCPVVF